VWLEQGGREKEEGGKGDMAGAGSREQGGDMAGGRSKEQGGGMAAAGGEGEGPSNRSNQGITDDGGARERGRAE
jgi:hypothetical protein